MEPSELRRIARAISTVENQSEGYEEILVRAYRVARCAEIIGITGPPGAGKSTLIDALTAHWAVSGERIAVLAIDPSSPFSGGAVLGDRIRRARSAAFANVYFRSLSSRGHVGGLSTTAADLIAVLSLFGFGRVIVETVGAGQSDIEIHATADCTVVVTVPGLGDGVQASKAGLMEIGDIFVVNKADMPGAEGTARTIENALAVAYMGDPGVNPPLANSAPMSGNAASSPGLVALRRRHGDGTAPDSFWVPPVIQVVASENNSVPALAKTIDHFLAWIDETGRRFERGKERAYGQLVRELSTRLLAPYLRAPGDEEWPPAVAGWIERIVEGQSSPIEAARMLLQQGQQGKSS